MAIFEKSQIILFLVSVIYFSQKSLAAADWPLFGGDPGNSHHQAETKISPTNAGSLEPKWSVEIPGNLFKSAVVDASGVYVATDHFAVGLDKNDGGIRWQKNFNDLAAECQSMPGEDIPPMGLASETSPAIAGDRLVFATTIDLTALTDPNLEGQGGGFLLITDKAGNCLHRVLVTEHPYEGVLGSPSFHRGVAYVGISGYEEQAAAFPGYSCCSTIGKVCAVDVEAGVKKWCSHLIDADPSTPEYDLTAGEITVEGISGVTVWSSAPAIDEKNNQVIVTTGNAYTISGKYDPGTLPAKSLPVDAFVAVDLDTGIIQNVHRVVPEDFWNVDCLEQAAGNCEFEPVGPDYDFGAGASLLNVGGIDVAVAINKAGKVYAVKTSNLEPLWETKVGPTTLLGLAGTATDGNAVYASHPNFFDIDLSLLPENPILPRAWQLQNCPHPDPQGSCPTSYGGILSSLDPATGEILWQNTDAANLVSLPAVGPDEFSLLSDTGKAPYLGPPAVTNGVVFQGSLYPNIFLLEDEVDEETAALIFGQYPNANAAECPFPDFLSGGCMATFPSMFAYDAISGNLLWTYNASGPVIAGAAVSDGVVYWGSNGLTGTSTVYAFSPKNQDAGVGGGPAPPDLRGGGCSLQVNGR